jgi:ferredoxin
MYIILIDVETCEGCGDCVDSCPMQLLALQEASDREVAVVIGSLDECLGCEACVVICPSGSVTMMEA